MEIDFAKLREPFKESEIEWRIKSSGIKKDGKPYAMVLAYVDNRAIMNRLDEVCGPPNWRNEFSTGPDGGVLCGLSIRVNGEWITKWDGAPNTKVEEVKGGISDAMKRAAVQWGVGRFLYDLPEGWAEFVEKNGRYNSKIDNAYYWWNPPRLPGWALPKAHQPPSRNGKPDGFPVQHTKEFGEFWAEVEKMEKQNPSVWPDFDLIQSDAKYFLKKHGLDTWGKAGSCKDKQTFDLIIAELADKAVEKING